ncbi:metallophosphoesterase [Luteimonas sp. A478]
MKRFAFAALAPALSLAVLAPAQAQDAPTGTAAEVRQDWAPGGRPDRVVLTPGADASTGLAVSWRTDARQTEALAEIAPSIGTPAVEANARAVRGVTASGTERGGQGLYHSVRFSGLTPGQAYVYRLRGADGWSEWHTLRTAEAEVAPFRILYVGDTQNNILAKGSRTLRQGLLRSAPDVMVHAGDLTGRSHDWEWGEWTAAGGFAYAMVPQIPAAGNHEYSSGDDDKRVLGPLWSVQFTLPGNGVQSGAAQPTSYYTDYQGVRFIVLDGTAALGLDALDEQTTWLESTLASSQAHWNVVVQHQPIYTCARVRDTEVLKAAWEPIYRAHHVDLVLQGHDHCYSRVTDAEGAAVSQQQREAGQPQGPVYLVSVAGSKMYGLNDRAGHQPDRVAADTQLYQVIDVDRDQLTFRAYTATGELYDAFDLQRLEDGSNRLIDAPVALPPVRLCRDGIGPDGGKCLGSPRS